MWSQLDVSVSLQSLQDEVDHTSRSQRLRFDVTPAHEFSLTKTPYGAPLTRNHLKPPIGIPCMNLDFIDLRLNLSRCPSIQPKSAKRKRNEHSEGSREYEEDLPRELMNGFSTRIPVDSDEGIARSVRGLDDSSPIESPKRIGSPSINKRNMEPNDVCPRPTATPRSVGISSSNTASKRPSSPTHKLNLADLVKLVDFSLRGIICSPKTPMSLGVLLSSVTEHPRLEHLSPALFSPGYSEVCVSCHALTRSVLIRHNLGSRPTYAFYWQYSFNTIRSESACHISHLEAKIALASRGRQRDGDSTRVQTDTVFLLRMRRGQHLGHAAISIVRRGSVHQIEVS